MQLRGGHVDRAVGGDGEAVGPLELGVLGHQLELAGGGDARHGVGFDVGEVDVAGRVEGQAIGRVGGTNQLDVRRWLGRLNAFG